MFDADQAQKWVRERSETFFRGQPVPAKWHLTRERERLVISTHCRVKVSTPLGFQTRRTDPAVAERCHRCERRPTSVGEEEVTSLADQRKAAEREGVIPSSDIFKVKDGKNQVRIVSDALPHPGEFKGKPNFKWLVYVLDRSDGQVKPYFMPHRIFKILESFQEDEENAFEGMPMPYDIVINAKGAGTIDVEYTVIPRKPTALTAAERNLIDGMKPLKEVQNAIRGKNEQEPKSFDPDDIPV